MIAKLALAFSLFSTLFALIAILVSILNNRKTIRNQSRHEHTRMLMQLDTYYINDPELWAMYDKDPIRQNFSDDLIKKTKRKTIIYSIFNLLEVVFDFYTNVIMKSKIDEQYQESWDKLADQYFEESGEVRELAKIAINAKMYSDDFCEYLQTKLNVFNAKVPTAEQK